LESCPLYSEKILAGNFHEEDLRKKLMRRSRAYYARKVRGVETREGSRDEEGRNFKDFCNFQESSKIHEEELQATGTFEELEEFIQIR
jgi:hypothetical protein